MKKEKKVEQPEQFKVGRTELGELARLTGYKVNIKKAATMRVLKAFIRTIMLELEKGNDVVLPKLGVLKVKVKEPRFIKGGTLKTIKSDGVYVHYRYKVYFHNANSFRARLVKVSKKRFGEC